MEKNTLYQFFQGTSSREEERQIVDWLEDDPANEKIFEEERKLYNTFIMMDEKQILSEKPKTRRLSLWTRELMRITAVLIVAAGIGWIFYYRLERRIDSSENSVSVPVGQRMEMVLSDGTKVMVNSSSTLTYPAIFSGKTRHVQLFGEAFFDVAHDANHPFIVETSQCDIEVLGTEFNVEAYENRNESVVSLVKGKVKVISNSGNFESVKLSPNERARLAEGVLFVDRIPEHEHFLWRDGLITFRNAGFTELMNLFEKYFGFCIVYNTSRLPTTTFSGKILISEGIDHAFWVLQQNASFRYEKAVDSMTITIN